MSDKFHEELAALKKQVLVMGHLVIEMQRQAIDALRNQDKTLAEDIISRKNELMDMDAETEEDAIRLLTLYQPMARDLRIIAASLKIITYLTRIGRYGRDIAKVAVELSDKSPVLKLVSITYMANIVHEMITDALIAYDRGSLSSIEDLSERDDNVDALRYSIFRECISYMIEDPKTITECSNYIMIARYLERCGDHACKMAEKIYYAVTGERIEIK